MPLLCYRSFAFTINNIPGGHILVMAVVTPVRLEVSSEKLVLRPYDFLLKTCFRETVMIYNHQNYLVHFEWHAVNTSRGIGFHIHPTKGNSLLYLFDLDIHLFMCSGNSHLFSMYCMLVLRT